MPISAMSYPVLDVVTKVVTKVDTLAYEAPARRCDDRLHRSVPASGQRKAVDEDTRIRRVEHANRTMIEAFAALAIVRGTPEPSPLEPERLPKHVRYRCATPRRGLCVDRVQNTTVRR